MIAEPSDPPVRAIWASGTRLRVEEGRDEPSRRCVSEGLLVRMDDDDRLGSR